MYHRAMICIVAGPSPGFRVELYESNQQRSHPRTGATFGKNFNIYSLAFSTLPRLENDPHCVRVFEQRQRLERDGLAVQSGCC